MSRNLKLAGLAVIAVLTLCGIALAAGLADYISHPGMANAHVPPLAAAPARIPQPDAPPPTGPPLYTPAPVDTVTGAQPTATPGLRRSTRHGHRSGGG